MKQSHVINFLSKKDVAQKLVEKQLREYEPNSPKLLCILGDLTNDPTMWQKAWDVSDHHYSRAMRSLGAYHFRLQDYQKAVEFYQQALRLNSLFVHSWYMLGCAAMQIENWEVGMEAFQRVVQLDYENGEAWNNLASIYLRLDNKKLEAWHALREALKSKFDSWQIWSNYLINSVALGKFSTAIYAMSRIVDLKGDKEGAKAVDIEILRIIINAVTRGQQSSSSSSSTSTTSTTEEEETNQNIKLAQTLEKFLVDTIAAKITAAPDIWRASADYWFWKGDYKRCLECYQKSFRYISTMPQVAYDPIVFEDAVAAAIELVEMYENLGPKHQKVLKFPTLASTSRVGGKLNTIAEEDEEDEEDGAVVCPNWQRQAKMALRSLTGKTKASFEGTAQYNHLVNALEQL